MIPGDEYPGRSLEVSQEGKVYTRGRLDLRNQRLSWAAIDFHPGHCPRAKSEHLYTADIWLDGIFYQRKCHCPELMLSGEAWVVSHPCHGQAAAWMGHPASRLDNGVPGRYDPPLGTAFEESCRRVQSLPPIRNQHPGLRSAERLHQGRKLENTRWLTLVCRD